MSQQAHRPSGRMSAQVYELLKARLVSGEFAPQSWIRVETLKGEYGVSKQPIMDALRMLNADHSAGWVPGRKLQRNRNRRLFQHVWRH